MPKNLTTKEKKKKSLSSAQSLLSRLARRLADSPLPALAVVITFVLTRWWQNSDFSYPVEILVPAVLFAVLVSIIFYLYRWILGPGLGSHLATILLSWSLYSYRHIKDTDPSQTVLSWLPDNLQTEFIQSLLLAVLLAVGYGLAAWLIDKAVAKYKFLQGLQPLKIILFAILFIFIVQIGRTGMRLLEAKDQLTYDYSFDIPDTPSQTPGSKPDIYYLVFDRYGNQQALADNFDFDNSDLYNFLGQQGFTNRPDAYANYPFTMSSVSSTMAMNYFPELEKQFGDSGPWQTAFPYRDILNNSPLAKVLKQNGYQYNQVSSWWDFTRVGIAADSEPTKSFRLNLPGWDYYLSDLQRSYLDNSILSPWLKKGISFGDSTLVRYDLTRNPPQNFEAQIAALKDLAARNDKSVPQFSFAHVLVPHDPYVFDVDGSMPDYDGNRNDQGVDETIKYTNQVTYLNSRIKELVSYIRQKSPNAAIVIQADEGPYPKEFRFKLEPGHYYDPINLDTAKMKQKFSILASYYLPGVQASEAPINSSVNTFRYILNYYLGYDLDLLPDCHLSTGDKYTVYKYQEVSGQLTGQSSADCLQFDPVR